MRRSAPYWERLRELGRELDAAQAPVKAKLDELRRNLDRDLEPHRERMDELAGELEAIHDDFDPELPERPEPDEPAVDRDELLYEWRRHWWDQLKVFKRFKDPHVDGWWAA